ncbi:MAG: amidohydrolase family protein [Treponema sp.]|jgi:dihydroorotase|nr:amidohydrolase family protein [Treponema sp.]
MLILLKNFRIVDETTDSPGSVFIEDGFIRGLSGPDARPEGAALVLDGGAPLSGGARLVLMPAFVDLHAHFRDPGASGQGGPGSESGLPAECIESACLAAAAGGYGTVVCMANTRPPVDSYEKAAALKSRSDALGLIDLFPVLSLTRNMEGKDISVLTKLPTARKNTGFIRLLSEDGRDVSDDGLFFAALTEAGRAGIPVSCHCDLGGEEAAVRRAIGLAARAGARIHIAHVSTGETADLIRNKKTEMNHTLSCEATPHHLALTEGDAAALGRESFGKVSPPLRSEEDRLAVIEALIDGTIDAIATDHAPHTRSGKEGGAPGFSGLETAFAVCYSTLTAPRVRESGSNPPRENRTPGGNRKSGISLSKLSSLMSAAPARILGLDGGTDGLGGRGRIAPGYRADICVADLSVSRIVESENFMSRGKNSPFVGRNMRGGIVLTIHGGRVVYDRLFAGAP